METTNLLPTPQTQVQEVLYLLLKNDMSRKDFMDESFVLNSPACISRLRDFGVAIKNIEKDHTNKFGRKTSYVYYSLKNKLVAEQQYRRLVKCNK